MNKSHCLIFLLISVCFVNSVFAAASTLSLNAVSQRMAGKIVDGTVLANGQFKTAEQHDAFNLWMSGAQPTGQHPVYTILGSNNSGITLRVRLSVPNKFTMVNSERGVTINSQEPVSQFYIVADGEQHVAVDTWKIDVSGNIKSDISGDTANAVSDLTFASGGKASMSVTPGTNLIAGKYSGSETIATFKASASAGTVAFRMTPGTGEFLRLDAIVKGKNTANTLKFVVDPDAYADMTDSGWIVPFSEGSSLAGRLIAGQQTVAPDTYVVSMDAVVWGE